MHGQHGYGSIYQDPEKILVETDSSAYDYSYKRTTEDFKKMLQKHGVFHLSIGQKTESAQLDEISPLLRTQNASIISQNHNNLGVTFQRQDPTANTPFDQQLPAI